MYKIEYTMGAKEDLLYWQSNNPKILNRIEKLIENMQLTPFSGIGKPEPLKHEHSGFWSRRITSEHRLVYKIHQDVIYIAQCRFHY